jgi:hypothetical protein
VRGFVTDVENATVENGDRRRVLLTGCNAQLVLSAGTCEWDLALNKDKDDHGYWAAKQPGK